jgi:hypothetical protein
METLLKFIGYNIPAIVLLVFAAWCYNNDHMVTGGFAVFVAVCSFITPKTS